MTSFPIFTICPVDFLKLQALVHYKIRLKLVIFSHIKYFELYSINNSDPLTLSTHLRKEIAFVWSS